jgi:undecaprenyl-diphosphatase
VRLTLLQLVVLALVQGITEFLPISSSAHLILVPALTDWPDQGLLIDVAVHVGSLLAVVVYFAGDLWRIVRGLAARGEANTAPFVGMLIAATIPVCIAGYAVHEIGQEHLRDPEIIAWATIVFGIVLYVADRVGMTLLRMEHMTWRAAILIGLAQVLALIPGTSRSGITMTAARMLGFERDASARFSLLLSIPVITAAALLAGYDLYKAGNAELSFDALVACGLTFVSAYVTIWALMAWLRRSSFTPFVVYRLVLGVGLLAWLYT